MTSQSHSSGDQRIALEFRERFVTDQAEGRERTLAEYIARWPDHEVTIAREYLEALARSFENAEPSGTSEPAADDEVGPYRLEGVIGRGGQGVVYRATDSRLGRTVALKVLSHLGPEAGTQIQRFRREAEVTSKLDHPGICSVYEAGIENGLPYIASRFIDGETLASRLKQDDDAPESMGTWIDEITVEVAMEAAEEKSATTSSETSTSTSMSRQQIAVLLRLFEKIARALHAAHEAGVIHRDIKPGNIMVGHDGDPVILDFGLARDESDGEGPTLTHTGDVFGTPAYMSPEQVSGKMLQLDRRTDVYSLGATLYQCLTGTLPFEAPTREGLFQSILFREPQDARKLNRAISQDLKVVLDAAMEKDREKRYADARALADDLAAILDHRPIAAKPISALGRLTRWSRRRPGRAALLAATIIGLPLLTYLVGVIVANQPKIAAQERAALEKQVERLVARGYYELHHVSAERAEATFTEARQLIPDAGEAIGGEALALLARSRPESALEVLGEASTALPELRRIERSVLRALGRESEARAIEETLSVQPGSPFGLFLLAQENMTAAHALGRRSPEARAHLRRSLQAFERAISYSPSARLVHYLGFTHAVMYLPEEVHTQPLVEGLTANWPDTATAWLWTGYVAGAKGDHEKEIACYERAEEIDANLDLISLRADALADLDRHEEALALLEEALRRYPDNLNDMGSLAVALNNLHRHEEAYEVSKRVLARSPDDLTSLIAAIFSLRKLGRFDEGIQHGRHVAAIAPWSAIALTEYAWALNNAKRTEEALEVWDQAFATGRDAPSMPRGKGWALNDLGRYQEAVPFLEEAVKREPHNPDAWNGLATALWGTGNMKAAEEAARRGIELEDDVPEFHSNLANIFTDQQKYPEALEALDKALELAPEDGAIIGLKGHVLGYLGRNEEAVAYWKRSLGPRPDHIETRVNLATTLMTMERMDEAREHFLYAAAMDLPVRKKNAIPFYGIASGLSRMGQREEAKAAYRKSIASDPTFAEAHCNLAGLEQADGNLDAAIEGFRRGHAAGSKRRNWPYPSQTWLANVLTSRFRELGDSDPERQSELAREILQLRPDDVPAMVALARWRAAETTPEAQRDRPSAVALSVRAVNLTKRGQPLPLHTLATALFASGSPAAAVAVQEEAIALMKGSDAPDLKIATARSQLKRLAEAAGLQEQR